MTLELEELNLPETDNPFFYQPENEDDEFIAPIKNPFSCQGAYELAYEDVKNKIEAYREVGYEVPAYNQMLKWLDMLAYEYI